jgi:hypothetical protein
MGAGFLLANEGVGSHRLTVGENDAHTGGEAEDLMSFYPWFCRLVRPWFCRGLSLREK